ncbi:PP2C family protein-serine/threonine phosphatase [Candidatus Omnitrophota bacterium]
MSIKTVPENYKAAFLSEQTDLIKSRVGLLCVLSVGLYFLGTIIGFLMAPLEFDAAEINFWILLLAGAAAVLYLNKKIRTMRAAKLNAYFFTALLLAILTNLNIIYHQYIDISSTLYIFLLFLAAFTIPWDPWEVSIITALHMLAYTFLFFFAKRYFPETMIRQSSWYLDGIMFLFLGSIFCAVIRKKEASRDIENFVLLKQVEAKSSQMQKELELATRIHKTLIPRSVSTNVADIAVTYLPIYYMGGDYAKFHFIDKNRLIFIICDVTGHGVSAALLVNRIHSEFERLVKDGKEPGALLNELNGFIKREFKGVHMYLSAFCGLLNFTKRELVYSNHGHPTQYIYRITRSEIHPLSSQGGLLGLPLEDEGIHQHRIEFGRGDRILLFTDGVTETRNADDLEYGEESLKGFISRNHDMPADIFNRKLMDELQAFRHGDFKDDIFVLNIHIK